MVTLRTYQVDAVDAVIRAWASGMQRPAVVAATGAGKTVVFAHLIGRWAGAHPGRRALVIAHRGELLDQAADKIWKANPGLSVGVVKAGRDETSADVIVASVQTLTRPGRVERIRDVGLVVYDECHHAAADGNLSVLKRLGCFREGGPVAVGFTATMARSDEKKLSRVWESVVSTTDILTLMKAGYLCDARPLAIEIAGLDLATVARRTGDFADGSLSDALSGSNAHDGIVKAYLEHGEGRPTGLFAPTVAFATMCRDAFRSAGVSAEIISGKTEASEREEIYEDFRSGKTRILCNCQVLTEGFDMPRMSCLIIARPTQSPVLYTQMVGRVLRTHPEKDHALILDVVGAVENNSLAGLIDLSPDIVDPKDGESVMEAMERAAREKRRRGGAIPLEHMTARQVELFANSAGAWKQTRAGVWFIGTRTRNFVLWPDGDDTFLVAGYRKHGAARGQTLARGLSMDVAKNVAEEAAFDSERADSFSVADRRAPWRGRKEISSKQRSLADELGVVIEPGMKSGQVSDAIDIELASRFLDPKLKPRNEV